jgi:DNA-binding CsgD family transcriptional regulator
LERGKVIPMGIGPGRRGDLAAALPPALLARVLDDVREGIMLVASQGRLLFANPAARRLLGGGAALALSAGRVRSPDGVADRLLHRAIEQACGADPPALQSVVIHQVDRIPLVITVRCVRDAGCDAHALLLAIDPHPDVDGLAAALRACFGLTRSEAEVAAAVAEGRAVAAIARQRGVAVGTIRTQLKRIAAKLGCARQSQIAAIVNAVPPAQAEAVSWREPPPRR